MEYRLVQMCRLALLKLKEDIGSGKIVIRDIGQFSSGFDD